MSVRQAQSPTRRRAILACLGMALAGCPAADPDAPTSAARPAAASVQPAPSSPRCRDEPTVPVLGLPSRAGEYCLDAGVDVRRYGLEAPLGLDAGCAELFPGACDLEKSFGLDRLLTLQYTRWQGPRIEVRLRVSEFGGPRAAYGFYAARVLADVDTDARPFSRLSVKGRGALRDEVAYLWSGRRVAELRMSSPTETPDVVRSVATRELGELATRLDLAGNELLPYELVILESAEFEGPVVAIVDDHLLDLAGSGPGATADASDDAGGYRQLLAVRRDESSAKDLVALLGREYSGKWLRTKTVLRVRRARAGHDPETWYFARSGAVVVGVGPLRGADSGGRALDDAATSWFERLERLNSRVRSAPRPEAR